MEISTDDRFVGLLRFIGKIIPRARITIRNGRHILKTTAAVDEEKLEMTLAQGAVTFMKLHYFETHLTAPRGRQINFGALLRVLTAFDHKTDIIITSTLLKAAPRILLDSIYDFALRPLHKRWAEVARLVNESMANLMTRQMFNDFVRFLISNLEHKVNEAHIMQGVKRVLICNDELTPLPTRGDDIICELIDISPRRIFIHSHNNDIEKNLIKNIEQFFPNCVTISYANINS